MGQLSSTSLCVTSRYDTLCTPAERNDATEAGEKQNLAKTAVRNKIQANIFQSSVQQVLVPLREKQTSPDYINTLNAVHTTVTH